MATKHSKSTLDARIAELIAQGRTSRAAEMAAKRERKAAHPQHKAAIARRWQMAQDRRNAVAQAVQL